MRTAWCIQHGPTALRMAKARLGVHMALRFCHAAEFAWPRPCSPRMVHNGEQDLKKARPQPHGRKRVTKGPMAGLSLGSMEDKGTAFYKSNDRCPQCVPHNAPYGLRPFSSFIPPPLPVSGDHLPFSVPYRAFRQYTVPLSCLIYLPLFHFTKPLFPSLTPPNP